MLFRILFDLLQVFVVAIFGQPCYHITIGPVDLQRVGMFIVNVILKRHKVQYPGYHLISQDRKVLTSIGI